MKAGRYIMLAAALMASYFIIIEVKGAFNRQQHAAYQERMDNYDRTIAEERQQKREERENAKEKSGMRVVMRNGRAELVEAEIADAWDRTASARAETNAAFNAVMEDKQSELAAKAIKVEVLTPSGSHTAGYKYHMPDGSIIMCYRSAGRVGIRFECDE